MHQFRPRMERHYSHQFRVSYPDKSLNQDIKRLRDLWHKVQADRDRGAIYLFLTGAFELVKWWTAEGQAVQRAQRALTTNGLFVPEKIEPFAAVIAAAISPDKLDKRKLSKYSCALRVAALRKPRKQKLESFIKECGGLNGAAAEFGRCDDEASDS